MKKNVLISVFLMAFVIPVTLFSQIQNTNVTNECWFQNGPMVVINPTNPNKLVCVYNDSRSSTYKAGWSWSDDGGLTWTYGGNISFAGLTYAANAVLAFDNTGTAYLVGLAYNLSNNLGRDGSIFIAKSNNGGHTFNVFSKIIASGSGITPHLDKPWLYINPENNNIYIAWVRRENAWNQNTESNTIWFTKSVNGGQDFSTPKQISTFSPATGTNRSHGPQITSLSANKVYVAWHTIEAGNPITEPWKIWIAESLNGGDSFGTNYKVLNAKWGLPNLFISMDADPVTGRIYITYADSYVQTPREYDIYLTSSTSVSGAWSTPVRVNDNPTNWQIWPSLDVAPNGRVDVMWYDKRDDPNKIGIYYSSSNNGGVSWTRNIRITDLPTGYTPSSDPFTGDYNSVSSLNEKAQIAWMDFRHVCPYGHDQEIYTATVIIPQDSICFPPHRGVPGSPNPPIIDGKVQEDVGWRGAYRVTYGNGTNVPHVAVQALKHSSDNYIFLSFEVRNDPTFDNNDVIVINFRPDAAVGTFANDRKIVIYPLCDTYGAGGQACGTTTPDDKINQFPRQIRFYRNSQSWVEIPASQISNLEAKVRSYTDGNNKAWNVELKIPTSTSNGGSQWGNFSDNFLFYYNVIRVSGTNASEFLWPESSPLTNGQVDQYPFYPWEWGKANKSSTAACNGVYLSNYLDIGTSNSPSSKIGYSASLPNTFVNTFYANVRNNSEVNGVPKMAEDVQVRFRLANWGIPSLDDWSDIQVSNPTCPNVQSNPTCLKDIAAGTSSSSGLEPFNLEWKVPDPEIPLYQAHEHQCLLAELDSRSNTRITTKSIYRNMDFGTASKHIRPAEISAKGYRQVPEGFVDQQFSLQVYTNEYVYGGGISFDTMKLKTLLNKKQFDEKKPVSILNYNVHGYRYNGKVIIINEKKYDIIDPVGSFGYIISHQGLVREWKHSLTGCEMIQPQQYRLSIPTEQKKTVITEIEPIELLKKWSISLHAGTAIPMGALADSFKIGFNAIMDVGFSFAPRLSLQGYCGYNNLKSKYEGLDDNYWINLSLNLKYKGLLTPSPNYNLYYYIQAGPGYYLSKNGKNDLGANLGAGLDYDAKSNLTLELGTDYHTLFDQDVKFWHVHTGIIFRF